MKIEEPECDLDTEEPTEDGNFGYFDTLDSLEEESQRKRIPKRSLIWSYFTCITKDLASCKACERGIPTKTGSTSGLSNHLKAHHKAKYHELQRKKQAKSSRTTPPKSKAETKCEDSNEATEADSENKSATNKSSLVWDYFTIINGDYASCNDCDLEILTEKENTSGLVDHLNTHHTAKYNELLEKKSATPLRTKSEDIEDEDLNNGQLGKETKRSIIWQYFTRRDQLSVTCNDCSMDIKTPGNTTNLARLGPF